MEAEGNRSNTENQSGTGWESVSSLSPTPEARWIRNNKDHVVFSRAGDEIVFGETKYTCKADILPGEGLLSSGSDDYYTCAMGIVTRDGNQYVINQGVFADLSNNQMFDLIQKRLMYGNGEKSCFPKIRIGDRLPYEEISAKLKTAEGDGGKVERVVVFSPGHVSDGSKPELKMIQDYIRANLSDKARDVRRKYNKY